MRAKKDIYAGYGIEYVGGKIRAPWGELIPELLPIGTNTKVGNAATWSIYHGNETINAAAVGPKCRAAMEAAGVDAVAGSCPCHCKGCYCDAGRYNFDGVRAGNVRKLIIARLYTDFMTRAIKAQIEADGITQVRIHAAGDFFSPEYVAAWVDVITATPGVTYWTYTKYAPALEAFAPLRNASIVPSLTPEGVNFGTCAEVIEMRDALMKRGYRVHVCACGTAHEKHCSECSTGCKAVGRDCDYVLFIKHSTPDYKAGKNDAAALEALTAIIAGQDN